MAGQRRGMSLPLLLSFAVLDVTLGTTTTDVTVTRSPTFPASSTPRKTMTLLPTTTTPLPPSSPETSTPEVLSDAFIASAATPWGSSPAASSIPAPQARGSTAHSTPGLPVDTMVQPDPPSEVLGLTSGTPDPTLMATTPNCDEPTIITSVGNSTALAVSSFGVKTSTLPPPTSTLLPSTWVGTTLGTSTHQGPAMTTPLGSTSPGTGSASSPTAPAPTAASDEPLTTSDTMATPITSTGIPGSTPIPSQLAGTTPPTTPETPGDTAETTATDVTTTMSSTFPTSLMPMKTSALLPTTNSTTTGTLPPSSPETGASTLERSSTSSGISSTSPPSAAASTAASAEPLTTLADTTDTPVISTGVPGSNPAPSQSARTTSRITSGMSTMTMGLTPGTPTISGTDSTPADLPTTLPVCPTSMPNTSASYLFLSLRLTVSLDLGNTTVQELILSQLRRYLQTAFPCAGLEVGWRGHRRT
ncbi:uncharacterized protein LOC141963048 isoform X1 [Athene noctua]|uniref:uncharacterized protein LOC141963048 isoform X1 n=1 Tax=Athene noctua TaxID=126797 RepID=UPI003EB79006